MDWSVKINWVAVVSVEALLFLVFFVWNNIKCDIFGGYKSCMKNGLFRIILIAISGIMFIAQAWLLLNRAYSKRKKVWNFISEKWNLFRNNVVELNSNAGDEHIEV